MSALDGPAARQLVAETDVAGARTRRPADRGGAAGRQAGRGAPLARAGAHLAAVLVPQRDPGAARRLARGDRPAPAHGRSHRLAARRRPRAQGADPDGAGRSRPPRGPRAAHLQRLAHGGADRAARGLGPQRGGPRHVAAAAGRAPRGAAPGGGQRADVRRGGGSCRRPAARREPPVTGVVAVLLAASRVVTLDEAVQTARERQPQLRQARANTAAAEARSGQALAPLLPQVLATASAQKTTANAIDNPGSPSVGGPGGSGRSGSFNLHNSSSDSIAASQLIFDFGASPSRWRAAKALAEAQGASERATALAVDFNVRSAFFNARANKALAQVAKENLDNQLRHLEQTQGMVEAGTPAGDGHVQAATGTPTPAGGVEKT